MSNVPPLPKLYHIVHVDRLPSILSHGCLWSDSEVSLQQLPGTNIGMNDIKNRRMRVNQLTSHPNLFVGECVPFYFCPRSVMLYILHMGNHPNHTYTGGQQSIVHLVADMNAVVAWATQNGRRWAFTNRNAGSFVYDDWSSTQHLAELDWDAINANAWKNCQQEKQVEFLLEQAMPWHLIDEIGVVSNGMHSRVAQALEGHAHKPRIQVHTEWYY